MRAFKSFNSIRALVVIGLAIALSGCASWGAPRKYSHASSVVQYLFPANEQPPALTPGMAVLRPPVRVGIAFVPGKPGVGDLAEADRIALLEKVRAAFAGHEFVSAIEIIPAAYLRPGGGFANLDQAARMFNFDVVALMSYDQVQFNDASRLSLLYWTLIGAYLIEGDRYDIHTLLDLSVFDMKSRRLLLRAPGVSQVKGAGTAVTFSENSRNARVEGYQKAVDVLIPNLQKELDRFPERVKAEGQFKVEPQAGYRGKGDAGVWFALGLLLAVLGLRQARRPARS